MVLSVLFQLYLATVYNIIYIEKTFGTLHKNTKNTFILWQPLSLDTPPPMTEMAEGPREGGGKRKAAIGAVT